MSTTCLSPAVDRGHDLGSDPRARESLLWNVVLPNRKLFVIAYFTRKATPEAALVFVAFGPDGPVALELAPEVEIEGDDLGEFAAGPLTVRHTEPLVGVEVAYTGERIELDCRFAGFHDAWDFERNLDGCAPVAATNRFEQSGEIEGTLRVDGREIPFATTGHRDHSWGVRDYPAILHWKWISAQAGPDLAFHAMHTWWRGRQYTNGYVWRDGTLSGIVDLRVDTEYDAELLQQSARFEICDEAGRSTFASAERFAGGFLPLGDVVMAEAGCRFDIHGRDGVGVFEQGWQPGYLEHLRSHPTKPWPSE
jgi:hypothetical protein